MYAVVAQDNETKINGFTIVLMVKYKTPRKSNIVGIIFPASISMGVDPQKKSRGDPSTPSFSIRSRPL